VLPLQSVLKEDHGIRAWADSKELWKASDVDAEMPKGMDNALIFGCCLTQRYIDKVVAADAENAVKRDYCEMEVRHALRRKPKTYCLPILMEDEMTEISRWRDQVGLLLPNNIWAEMWDGNSAEDPEFRTQARRVAARIFQIHYPHSKDEENRKLLHGFYRKTT